jgi:predicted RNA-binding Zn ribbon-like protein
MESSSPPKTEPTQPAENPRAAPGRLELVREFINTADLYPELEELVDLRSLRSWLSQRGLIAPREQLRDGDLERALALREALRSLLEVRDRGVEAAAPSVDALNRLAATALLRVGFDSAGAAALEPATSGLDGAFAQLFAAITLAEAEGTWARLKVCAAHECLWAFYDRSKNRSRSWCNMAVCGNRAKARQYRLRHRAAAAAPPARAD